MNYLIKPSKLSGRITIPPSKSHTLRAILFASMAKGKSIIHHYLHSPDTLAMIAACQALGAEITIEPQHLIINGTDRKLNVPRQVIDAGNSGQVLRFISAVAALLENPVMITGDHSICTNRPIQPLLSALQQLNVKAISNMNNGHAPVTIQGPLNGGKTSLNGEDSQPVSGLLIAAAFAKNPTHIQVLNPGETPWIDVTLDWFKRLGISYRQQGYTDYYLPGNAAYSGFEYTVPGDFSSCAFPLIAALITQSEIILANLDMSDSQGDKALISLLQKMGANIEIDNHNKQILVKKSPLLSNNDFDIDINHCIDALPILAVSSCFTNSKAIITGAAIARKKESNRLAVIAQELGKLGAKITEHENGLIVLPSKLTGNIVQSHHDHRIAMALIVAGLAATGETIIQDTLCISKSYPNFVESMRQLGAHIEVLK